MLQVFPNRWRPLWMQPKIIWTPRSSTLQGHLQMKLLNLKYQIKKLYIYIYIKYLMYSHRCPPINHVYAMSASPLAEVDRTFWLVCSSFFFWTTTSSLKLLCEYIGMNIYIYIYGYRGLIYSPYIYIYRERGEI